MIATTLRHVATTAGFINTKSFGTAQSAYETMEAIFIRHIAHGPRVDGGDFPATLGELKKFQSQVPAQLKDAFSNHVLAGKSEITEELVRNQRATFELVPDFVEMELLSKNAGEVLISGAMRFFPFIYVDNAILGSHVDALTQFCNGGHPVPAELAYRLQLALENFGITDDMAADHDFALVASGSVTRDISNAMTQASNEEILFQRYGLTPDILQRAFAVRLIDGESYTIIKDTLKNYDSSPALDRRLASILAGMGLISSGVLFAVGGLNQVAGTLLAVSIGLAIARLLFLRPARNNSQELT